MNSRTSHQHAARRQEFAPRAQACNDLERAKARPRRVEAAVRSALGDAVAWRIGGGAAPGATAFATAAIANARLQLDTAGADRVEQSRVLAAVGWAAGRFARSALCRRIMTVPATRFVRAPGGPHGPDVLVRDRRGRLHAVIITARCNGLEAARIATAAAAAIPLPSLHVLTPMTVHVYALATGVRHSCTRDVGQGGGRLREMRVA